MPTTYNQGIRFISFFAFLFGILLLIGVSIVSYRYVKRLSENSNSLYMDYSFYKSYETINSTVFRLQSHAWEYLISGDEHHLAGDTGNKALIAARLKDIKPFFITSTALEHFARYEQAVSAGIGYADLLVQARRSGRRSAVDSVVNTAKAQLMAQKLLSEGEIIKRLLQADMDFDKRSSDDLVYAYNTWDMVNFLITFLIAAVVSTLLFRNLSRQNRLTQQLKQEKKKAEDAVIVKEQFLANMSHEIRTPMNAIIGFTNLLNKTGLTEKQEVYVQAVKSSSANLLAITNDILDYSKLESGMFRIEKITFDIRSLVHLVFTMFTEKAVTNKLDYSHDITGDIPPYLLGDPTRLTQILVNLLSNAFKFTAEGSVKLEVREHSRDEHQITLAFIVADTGIGIRNEHLDKIFERFNQAEASITRQYGGTGLGLSIVKRLVELQGGSVHVDSEYGKGTCFTVLIPYEFSQENITMVPAGEAEPESLYAGHKKVLLVEDNALNQLLAKELLLSYGLDVTLAENGEAAIGIVRERSFDLILMDLQMPVMDGYQTAEIIRNKLHIKTPIIAMSAHVLVGEKEKCLGSGMDDFVSKPFLEEEFKAVLKKYLSVKTGIPETKSGTESTDVVDLSSIKQMSKGNQEFVSKMIALFLKNTPTELEKMAQAIQAGDHKLLQGIAHKLKSSAGIIGMRKEAYVLLQAIEDEAAAGVAMEVLENKARLFTDHYLQAEAFLKGLE